MAPLVLPGRSVRRGVRERRVLSGLLAPMVVIAVLALPWAMSVRISLAQQSGRVELPNEGLPKAPGGVVAAKAYGMLERSCARCHQAGRLDGRPAGGGIANLLALDEVARDPALVRPGVPDASRLYNVAMTRELHLDAFNDPGLPEPAPEEVQALRDWITDLPPAPAQSQCRGREPMSATHLAALVDMAVAGLSPERARQARFVSLAHLHNSCMPDAELEALRRGLDDLLAGLAPKGMRAPAGGWAAAVDTRRLVFQISMTALGWRAADWDKHVAGYPLQALSAASTTPVVRRSTGSSVALVHADWLAHATVDRLVTDAGAQPAPVLWGLPGPQALAHAWRRPADQARVVADLALPPGAELEQLPAYAHVRETIPARQLRAGGSARRIGLDHMLPALLAKVPVARTAEEPDRLEIALTASKPSYKAGETAVFSVVASRDCYLTLIGVDRSGRATVLLPSELQPDNRISAGEVVKVPADNASYRFRFKDRGRETIVAICSQTHKAPEGILHDYDRLRFTVLGDWQLFLREPPDVNAAREARRDDAATDIPRPHSRQRRRGAPAAPKTPAAPPGSDLHTRTAITVDIE